MSIPELPGIGNELSEVALEKAEIVTVTDEKTFAMKKSS